METRCICNLTFIKPYIVDITTKNLNLKTGRLNLLMSYNVKPHRHIFILRFKIDIPKA